VPALLIADVPYLLYRAFFALPRSIADSRGRPVNALLGTVNALLAAIEAYPPRAVVACLGAEQADYRVSLYAPYHAHREPMPAELAAQFELAPALLASLGWEVAASQTLEADDVMFSYARAEEDAGGCALLLTADRDMFGAVSESVAVLELRRGGKTERIGPEQVRARYGVDPHAVSDFIALRGDPSDGIPGAPGVGAKTAAELLRAHGSLEGVLEAAAAPATVVRGEMRARLAGTLTDNAAQLRAFKEIATLQRIEARPPADRPTDFAAGARSARALGMRRLAERLEQMSKTA
jgi:5'-3' exonuclease